MKDYIAPSILSADFLRMDDEIKKMEEAKADLIHYDVMDGVFVPEITYGEVLLRQMKKKTVLPIDVHLMIVNPENHIDSFYQAGASMITFHLEATSNPKEVIKTIHECNIPAAISVKPGTPIETVFPYLNDVEMVLVMTVNPGFGGQSFMPESIERIEMLRREIDRRGLNVRIQVDGGINKDTISLVKKAGADTFVSGSALFKGDFNQNMNSLREILAENEHEISD